jgi:DNA-binding winged helix-turn-helix (wHTH) protein
MTAPFFVGLWRVDPSLGQLAQGERVVRVRAKVMDLLVFLASRPGDVLSKDELLNQVWGTDAVSESALTRTITELRQAFGDDADHPAVIETIPKRGYRLVAAVTRTPSDTPPVGVDQVVPLIVADAPRRAMPLRRVVIVVLIVAATVAAGSMLHRRASIQFHQRDWVLVAAFENRTGESILDGTLEFALERELSNSPFVSVVPRDRVDDALALMKKPPRTTVDLSIARDVSLRDGAIKAIVSGRIERIGGRYAMTEQIVEPVSGEIIISFGDEVPRAADLLPAIKRRAMAIRNALGERVKSLPPTQSQLEKVTTPSLRALQLYSQAARLMSPDAPGDATTASQFAREALREDPSFASGHVLLAYTILNEGGDLNEAIRHAEEAQRLSASATVAERHFINGSVFHLRSGAIQDWPARNLLLDQAITEYQIVLRLQPDHVWAMGNLQQAFRETDRRADEAVVLSRLADLRPNNFSVNIRAARSVLEAHGLAAARRYVSRARRIMAATPETPYPPTEASYALLFDVHELWTQRRLSEAAAALGRFDNAPWAARGADWATSRIGFMHLTFGQLRLAEQAFGLVTDVGLRKIALAELALARNQPRQAVAELKTYRGYDLAAVSVLVRSGDIEAADRVRRTLTNVPPQHMRWAEQEIEEARGNAELVRIACAAGVPWTRVMAGMRAFLYSETLAEAAARIGDLDGAIAVLVQTDALRDKTLTPNSHTGYFWMRTQVLLADLYRRTGRLDEARAIERDLLAALAVADADYPMLVELQKRTTH